MDTVEFLSCLPPTLSLCSLDAVDPNAYDAFKASRNLGDVIDRVLRNQQEASSGSGPRKLLTVEASLMTPVQPMLVRQHVYYIFLFFPPTIFFPNAILSVKHQNSLEHGATPLATSWFTR